MMGRGRLGAVLGLAAAAVGVVLVASLPGPHAAADDPAAAARLEARVKALEERLAGVEAGLEQNARLLEQLRSSLPSGGDSPPEVESSPR